MSDPIIFDFFRGEAPKYAPRLLPNGYAQQAFNCKLFDGKLKPWNRPLELQVPVKGSQTQSIYAMRNPSTGDLVWLEWLEVVDVVESLIAGDTEQRICFTGYGSPKTTNYTMATSGSPQPKTWWRLGVPAPITAASVASGGGGSGVARDRVYLVTFVHQWADGKQDESAPSPPSAIISAKTGETVNLTNLPRWIVPVSSINRSGQIATVNIPAGYTDWFTDGDLVIIEGANESEYNGTFEITRDADNQFHYTVSGSPATPATGTITAKTNHDVQKKRIYRTVIGTSGAFYRFVAEVDEVDTTYNDTSLDAAIALQGAIPSLDWAMPPRDMSHIIDMGSGILAGISGNEVCFSEPYVPHSWPVKYRRTLPFQAVALGVVGSSLVVGCQGHPVVFTGTHPASMAENKLTKINHPCVSERGMLSPGFAVLYPSPEGLVSIGEGGTSVATINYHDRDTWKTVYPETLRAFQFADRYFGAYTSGADPQGNETGGAIILDREANVGGFASLNLVVRGGFYDKRSGELYILESGYIRQWDADLAAKMNMDYISKQMVLRKPSNYGAARVDADFTITPEELAAIQAAIAAVIAANAGYGDGETLGDLHALAFNEQAFNESLLETPPTVTPQSLTFTLYAGGKVRFSKTIDEADKPFKLPSGYKVDTVEVGLAGNVAVYRVILGATTKDLERA